ncbi:MAG: hypothetical protein IKS87_02120 [Lachnospiraceae bacterium]|nr:hypothetical protein [Lachnospiraceae bacterium]
MDDYMKELTKIVETAIEKAKELGGTAKLHALIKAEEAKKQEQYYRLGRKYYQLFADTPEKDLTLYVNKLKACDKRIEELREELKGEEEETYRDVEPKAADDERSE